MLEKHAKGPFNIKKPLFQFVSNLDHEKKSIKVQEHSCHFVKVSLKAAIPRLNLILQTNKEYGLELAKT